MGKHYENEYQMPDQFKPRTIGHRVPLGRLVAWICGAVVLMVFVTVFYALYQQSHHLTAGDPTSVSPQTVPTDLGKTSAAGLTVLQILYLLASVYAVIWVVLFTLCLFGGAPTVRSLFKASALMMGLGILTLFLPLIFAMFIQFLGTVFILEKTLGFGPFGSLFGAMCYPFLIFGVAQILGTLGL